MQNSRILSQASTINTSGTVKTIRMKPGKLKQGKPGNSRTLCSRINPSVNSKHEANSGNLSNSIFTIMYIEPFGIIGINPGDCTRSLKTVFACL